MTDTPRGRTDYADRKEFRIDRLRERANNATTKCNDHHATADKISDRFYMGQPILVGHHSEGKARRDQDKMHNHMGKAVDAGKKSDRLNDRANSAENNKNISNDDPEALVKLRKKLASLEKLQVRIKAANKIFRNKKMADNEKITELLNLGIDEESARLGLEPDYAGKFGIPSYALTGNNTKIRNTKKRIKDIQELDITVFENVSINGIDIVDNDNRIQMFFPGKPSEETRGRLKNSGFRWARSAGAWQAYRKLWNYQLAVEIANELI